MTVNIPVALRQYTLNESNLRVEVYTVGELLRKLDSSSPSLSSFIVTEGEELRRYVNIFVNEDDARSCEDLLTQRSKGLPTENAYLGCFREGMATDELDPAGVYAATRMGHLFHSSDEGKN